MSKLKSSDAACSREPDPPQLLVSVSSVAEARLAMELKVGWIDLKDPASGALGAPNAEVVGEVGDCLSNWPQRSVALGELKDWPRRNFLSKPALDTHMRFIDAIRGFQVAKFGLAGLKGTNRLSDSLAEASDAIGPSVSLVPVIYGDHETCDAPAPDLVLNAALEYGARFILIDTFEKTGKSLFDYVPPQKLADFVQSADALKIQVVLAGSLQSQHLPALWEMGAAAIGIRGAVTGGGRTETICKDKLAEWVNLFADYHSRYQARAV